MADHEHVSTCQHELHGICWNCATRPLSAGERHRLLVRTIVTMAVCGSVGVACWWAGLGLIARYSDPLWVVIGVFLAIAGFWFGLVAACSAWLFKVKTR